MDHERIIHILNYLTRATDDKHGVTIRDIQDHLANNFGMYDVSPLTIRRDIDRLETSGYTIKKKSGAHNTAYYSIKGKGFTFNEIRFLVDAVTINKFLTFRQKQELIKKFENMCSDSEIRNLISRIETTNISKIQRDLLGNLDTIHRLIPEHRKINFSYGKFDTHNNVVYYDKYRNMLPVKVIYKNERFYLRCFNEETTQFRNYRIDRIRSIKAGEISKAKPPQEQKAQGFVADIFAIDRFEIVTFRVKRYLLDEMLEQLGDTASPRDDFDVPGYAVVRANCGINRQFYLWVMRYGDAIEITAPKDIRQAFADELKNVSELYSDI